MKNRKIRKFYVFALVLVGLYTAYQEGGSRIPVSESESTPSESTNADSFGGDTVYQAYQNRQSNLQVQGEGKIVKILPDDNQGPRHQKFLLEVPGGITILIAHNIDLAPRVPSIIEGDTLGFHGEYEWSEKGGVVHWTHHDPSGGHPGGWLSYRGQKYQ